MIRAFGYAYHRSTQVRLYKSRESIPTWPIGARLARRSYSAAFPDGAVKRFPVAFWPFVDLTVAEVQCRRGSRRGILLREHQCFLSFLMSIVTHLFHEVNTYSRFFLCACIFGGRAFVG